MKEYRYTCTLCGRESDNEMFEPEYSYKYHYCDSCLLKLAKDNISELLELDDKRKGVKSAMVVEPGRKKVR